MRPVLLAAALAVTLLAPRPADAQVQVSINFDLPVVLPALVVIEPGIQVVPRVNEEVFFVDGVYWVRRDHRWWRSRDHRRGWVLVEPRLVPRRLVVYAPGTYRRWEPPGQERRELREHDKHEREQFREREKEDREQLREHQKHEREQQKERRKEHGKGD